MDRRVTASQLFRRNARTQANFAPIDHGRASAIAGRLYDRCALCSKLAQLATEATARIASACLGMALAPRLTLGREREMTEFEKRVRALKDAYIAAHRQIGRAHV